MTHTPDAGTLVERLRRTRTWKRVSEPDAPVYAQGLILDPICQEAATALAQAQTELAGCYRLIDELKGELIEAQKLLKEARGRVGIITVTTFPPMELPPDTLGERIDAALKETR